MASPAVWLLRAAVSRSFLMGATSSIGPRV
jgi:hypothetical protein